MAEIRFPNGRAVELDIPTDFLITNGESVPMCICKLCGFREGTDVERSDRLFALIEEIGTDAVSEKVCDNNSKYYDAIREGFELADDYNFK